jgi:phospholipid/cholesterol/gamma-HCH transport system ATP-binding protein
MTEPIISIRDLSVSYEGQQVLNRLNLDIQPNEIMVLLGGQRLREEHHVAAHYRPRAAGLGHHSGSRRGHQSLLPDGAKKNSALGGSGLSRCRALNSLSTAENVGLPMRELTSLAEPVIEIMIYMKLAVVGLADAGKLLPYELSGGMKKRAAVARAIALDPEILVFDEPSAGLDPIVSAELDELILTLKRAFQMTILVVTHEIASAFRIADRIAMLDNGSLIVVDNKDAFKVSTDPRIRQFLDRVPDPITESAAVQDRLRELAGMTGVVR